MLSDLASTAGKQVLTQLMGKIDILHLAAVLSEGSTPSYIEAKALDTVRRFLAVPVGGDVVWAKAVSWLTSSQDKASLALSYLNAGLAKAGLTQVADLGAARANVVELIDNILARNPIAELSALCQCPNCDYIFGETNV